MVTGTHPEDVELFDYVEGDLAQDRRAALEVHLASCAQCTEHVARMQAGRDALRGAPFLELPAQRRESILRDLPAPSGVARSKLPVWPKRMLAVLAAAALIAAAVVAIVTTGGGGSEEGAPVSVTTGAAGAEASTSRDQVAPAPQALTATGPAAAVAAELRQKGFDAHVVGNHVEVRNATRAEVRRALAHRLSTTYAAEHVRVVVRP